MNFKRAFTSLSICSAIKYSFSFKSSLPKTSIASSIDNSQISIIDKSLTVIAKTSGLSLLPLQAIHGRSCINLSISRRIKSLSVSLCLRSKLGITPSYVVSKLRPVPSEILYVWLPVPYKIMSSCFCDNSPVGTWRLKPFASATACIFFMYQASTLMRLYGRIAPSAIVSRPLGITSSGSTSRRLPSPVQIGQAPWGELKLNVLGSSSGIDTSG